jgi:hypothetical protein
VVVSWCDEEGVDVHMGAAGGWMSFHGVGAELKGGGKSRALRSELSLAAQYGDIKACEKYAYRV